MDLNQLKIVASARKQIEGTWLFEVLFRYRGSNYARVAVLADGTSSRSQLETLAKHCLLGKAPQGWEDGDQYSVQYC